MKNQHGSLKILLGILGCTILFFGCRHMPDLAPLDRKIIALTFDDGPNPLYTPKVLEILAEHDVKATFFLIGRHAQAFPEIVLRIKDNGHEIENHSQNHLFHLSSMNPLEIQKEICTAQETIFSITGEYPSFFRAPFGWLSDKLILSCQSLSLPVIDGTIKPRDASLPGKETIVSTVLDRSAAGSIIILHDGGGFLFFKNRSQTLAALPEILRELKNRGYIFVTVKELFDDHLKSVQSPVSNATFY